MDDIIFAGRDNKDTLFKFRPFGTNDHKDRVKEIILNHRIYFSKRSKLNDPFDLAPVFMLDRTDGEHATRSRLIVDAEARLIKNGGEFSSAYIKNKLATLAACDLDGFEAESRVRALDRIENEYFVFSLAGNRTHAMLWAHYADGHKGLCIHFKAQEPSIFSAAMKVSYYPQRPVVTIPLPTEADLMQRVTLWKGDFWSYEDEYRLVRFPKSDLRMNEFGLSFDGQNATYKTSWISGITVGAFMPKPDVATVLTIANAHKPALPVFKASPTFTYELTFERIAN